MGCYSFTCAKTGLPIASSDWVPDFKFSRVVVLDPSGDVTRGNYDGYGGVEGKKIDGVSGPGGAKLVLEHFYRGERYADLGNSGHDPDQGSFDSDLMPGVFAALEADPSFDSHQFLARHTELWDLRTLGNAAMDQIQGFDVSDVHSLRSTLYFNRTNDPEDVGARQAAWQKVLQERFGGALPAGHPVATMGLVAAVEHLNGQRRHVDRLIAHEVLAAWKAGRAARAPDVPALLAGDCTAWRELPVEPKKSRKARP